VTMRKKGIRSSSAGKSKPPRKRAGAVKTYAGPDRYSDAVVVEVGYQDSPFLAIRNYLRSWKEEWSSIDKEKKS
jgi:hypothetical protein